MKTAGIFETPLFLCEIAEHEKWAALARQEIETVQSGGDEYSLRLNDSSEFLSHTVIADKLDVTDSAACPKKWLNRPGWDGLREQIKGHVRNAYARYLGSDYIENNPVIITDSWVNVCNKDGYQFFHNHGNSMLSWTYFICLQPEKGHAQLAFNRPEICTRPYFAHPQGGTPYMDGVAIPDCREGQLLIWPGHLSHGYRENEADGRITMSGNSVPSVIRNRGYVLKVKEE